MPPKKKQKSSSEKSPARVTRGSAAAKKKSVEEEAKTFVLGSPEPGATMKATMEEDFSPIVQAALDAKPEAVAEKKDSSEPDPPVPAAVAEDEKPPPHHVDEIAAAAVAEAILDVDTGAVSLNKAGQPRKRKPRSKWSKEVSDSTAAVSLFSRWRKRCSHGNQLTFLTHTNLFFFRFCARTHTRRTRN